VEVMMISWAIRGLLIVSGFLASWFIARDALQFGLMSDGDYVNIDSLYRGSSGIWPERWSHLLNRLHK
jgi:hypothetical protein